MYLRGGEKGKSTHGNIEIWKDGNLREFEWWCAPELKVKFGFSTFVDVHHRFFTLADAHTGHRVDDLDNVLVGFALAAGSVADRSNGEVTGIFGDTTEISGVGLGLARSTVELVEHLKWSMAR